MIRDAADTLRALAPELDQRTDLDDIVAGMFATSGVADLWHTLVRIDAALVVEPCHVTGEHMPTHHLQRERVCSIQKSDMADRVAEARRGPGGTGTVEALPRRLHANCSTCHGGKEPEQEAWARREIPAPAPTGTKTRPSSRVTS